MDREVFLIIDGRSILDVYYHASKSSDRRSPSNVPIGALSGYYEQILKLLNQIRPTRILIVFNHENGSSYRKSVMNGYKANRPPKPLEHLIQIDLAVRLSIAMGIYTVQTPDAEADDVIATAIKRTPPEWHVTIASHDKDLTQLLTRPLTSIVWRHNGILTEFDSQLRLGVKPSQVVDYLALCGDAADGISGCPGIGQKTAQLLLEKFGSLSGIFDNVNHLGLSRSSQRISRLLCENKELILHTATVVRLRSNLENCGLPKTRGELAWSWQKANWDELELLADETGLSEILSER